jgi:hypothetical protein
MPLISVVASDYNFSLQFETEAESSRLRRDVQAEGSVAPLGVSKEDKASIHSLLSGREELFAFRRAVWPIFHTNTTLLIGHLEQYRF